MPQKYMNTIIFNTKQHTLTLELVSGTKKSYKDVMTVKLIDGMYEIFQKQKDGLNAPIIRIPLNNTIVFYEHE